MDLGWKICIRFFFTIYPCAPHMPNIGYVNSENKDTFLRAPAGKLGSHFEKEILAVISTQGLLTQTRIEREACTNLPTSHTELPVEHVYQGQSRQARPDKR